MFLRLSKVRGVAGVCGGAVVGWMVANNVETVKNSWTTNYTPSVAWDWNWDKREPSSLLKPSSKDKFLNSKIDPVSDGSFIALDTIVNGTDEEKLAAAVAEQKRKDDEALKLEALKSKATRYIILIRHGQYNLDGETDKERTLTKLGEEQARLTGERLKLLKLPISRLVYSTMTRATQTANIMLQQMDQVETVESCDLIREGAPIPPEPPVGHWRPEHHQFFSDGARIESGFRRFFHRAPPSQTEDSYEVLVCHANVIRYAVCRALQFPPEAWLRMSLHNGSITLLTIRPSGTVSIRQLGDCGHMPPASLSLT